MIEYTAIDEKESLNLINYQLCKTYDTGKERSELNRIIKKRQIQTLFQPIFDLSDNTIFSFETLSRAPKASPLHMPEILFSTAEQYQRLYDLDCLCREKSIQNFADSGLNSKLSLNIDPHALMDPCFEKGKTLTVLKKAGIANSRVILELTEHNRTDNYNELRKAAAHYRDMGFSIALNDLNAGYSNLQLMSELKPEYLKLDQHFISQLNKNKMTYDFIELVVNLAKHINCHVIAEGVETAVDLKAVRKLGIHYAQGHLLGSPEKEACLTIPDVLPETSNTLISIPNKNRREHTAKENLVVSLTLHPVPACSSDMSSTEVLQRFQSNTTLQAIPVIDDNKIVGILDRVSFLQAFSTTFGHKLNRQTAITKLMHAQPIVLKTDDLLTYASEMAMSRSAQLVYTPLIIANETGYLGTVSVRELLKSITQNLIKQGRQGRPLAGQIGNITASTFQNLSPHTEFRIK